MKHAVSGSVGHGAASVGLPTFTVVLGLSTEGSLIDLAFLGSGEWHTVRLELENGFWSFSGHVLDGVLIAKPIATFYGIVEMPSPVILMHVSKSSVDTTLSGNSVRSSWEQFRNTGGFIAGFTKSESSSESSATSSDNDGVVLVINNGIVSNK